jgi:hypothetical protein
LQHLLDCVLRMIDKLFHTAWWLLQALRLARGPGLRSDTRLGRGVRQWNAATSGGPPVTYESLIYNLRLLRRLEPHSCIPKSRRPGVCRCYADAGWGLQRQSQASCPSGPQLSGPVDSTRGAEQLVSMGNTVSVGHPTRNCIRARDGFFFVPYRNLCPANLVNLSVRPNRGEFVEGFEERSGRAASD